MASYAIFIIIFFNFAQAGDWTWDLLLFIYLLILFRWATVSPPLIWNLIDIIIVDNIINNNTITNYCDFKQVLLSENSEAHLSNYCADEDVCVSWIQSKKWKT